MGPSSHAKPTPTSAATIPPSGDGRFDRSLGLLQVSDQHPLDACCGRHRSGRRAPLDVELVVRYGPHGVGDAALAGSEDAQDAVLWHPGVLPGVLRVDRAL